MPEDSIEIVGVVRDSRYEHPHEPIAPMVFLPFEQAYRRRMTLLVRSSAPIGAELRDLVHRRFPELALVSVDPFSEQVRRAYTDHRMNAHIGAFLGALALLLTTFGMFSVVSYTVSQKAREIGIRMAIGAGARKVLAQVLASAGRHIVIGLVLGFALALTLSRLLEGLVFGVELLDPLSFVAVPAILVVSGLLAALLPALRATRLDPARVLSRD